MGVSYKHTFHSGKSDGTDSSLVQPSAWNAEHTVTMDSGNVLGRTDAGNGAVEEIAYGAMGLELLQAADLAAVLTALGAGMFTTGDVKLTIKTTADAGWIMCNDGTIGSATSTATYANANAQNLYTTLWNNVTDTYAPVTGGRGATAAADWAANKKMALTAMLGRALAIAGAGSGLTSRLLGQTLGEETHQLTQAELPSYNATATFNHNIPTFDTGGVGSVSSPGGLGFNLASPTAFAVGGSDTPHNNMQPTSFLNAMIKL